MDSLTLKLVWVVVNGTREQDPTLKGLLVDRNEFLTDVKRKGEPHMSYSRPSWRQNELQSRLRTPLTEGPVRFQIERRGPGVYPLLLNRVLRGSKVRLGIWCERRRDLAERPETRTKTHVGECVT